MKRDIRSYFRCEADYISFMLLYGEGRERIYALNIELELYTDKAAADKWLAWILANSDGEEATKKEIARLYKRMTGEDLPKAEETETEAETEEAETENEADSTEEQKTEEPTRFKVGGAAVDYQGKAEKVMKVTKCYVWFTYCGNENELEKRKIKRDSYGNEYVEYAETGWGRGCNGYLRYNAV